MRLGDRDRYVHHGSLPAYRRCQWYADLQLFRRPRREPHGARCQLFAATTALDRSKTMKLCRSTSIKPTWRALSLCAALLVPPASADTVSLSSPFSRFDDLYIVATVADAVQNCTNLRAAVPALGFLGVRTVRLPPATYDCGATTLVVPAGVTLEGSGQSNTKIIGQVDSSPVVTPVIDLRGEMSSLTVENTADSASHAIAVGLQTGSIANNVTARSQGNNSKNTAMESSGATITGCTLTAANGLSLNFGLILGSGSTTTSRSTLDASDTFATGVTVISTSASGRFSHTRINSEVDALDNPTGTPVPITVTHSQLVGTLRGAGTFSCFSVYNAALVALNADCTTPP